MGSSIAEISSALDDLDTMLQTDGYRLVVRGFQNHHLTVAVEAGADACEDCLVPKAVMADILRSKIPSDIHVDQIEITYPGDKEVD